MKYTPEDLTDKLDDDYIIWHRLACEERIKAKAPEMLELLKRVEKSESFEEDADNQRAARKLISEIEEG